jgi:hypothetical protein
MVGQPWLPEAESCTTIRTRARWLAPGVTVAAVTCHDRARKETSVRYLIVAEAYRDLEQLSSRLALTDRLARLLADTPPALLPTVCYLCQGLIAPEFAGIDLGVAEKLAIRAVAAVTGTEATGVSALVREAGDLGQAVEQLLAVGCSASSCELFLTARPTPAGA